MSGCFNVSWTKQSLKYALSANSSQENLRFCRFRQPLLGGQSRCFEIRKTGWASSAAGSRHRLPSLLSRPELVQAKPAIAMSHLQKVRAAQRSFTSFSASNDSAKAFQAEGRLMTDDLSFKGH